MIVPRFWAEARRQERIEGRQVTLRRFGWSNVDDADAKRVAEERVVEAMAQVRRGVKVPAREKKVPYNGANGLPIREEIVEERGAAVVTRNSYGARCLNVRDVLIADVDVAPGDPPAAVWVGGWLVGIGAAVASGLLGAGLAWASFACAGGLVGVVGGFVALRQLRIGAGGGAEAVARGRIEGFARSYPDWRLHLYRTPAGFRVLVTHQRFDPSSRDVAFFFEALRVDPAFVRMCRIQKCFRARLTAKPWRIGIETPLRPRPGVWPVRPERREERSRWIDAYEARARAFAACRFEASFGRSRDDPAAAAVRAWHDEASGANSTLPLA